MERGLFLAAERRYAEAIHEFHEASRLQPHRAEPLAARARALFRMERYEDVLAACTEALEKDARLFLILPTCWAAHLERTGSDTATKEAVWDEIEALLATEEETVALLYAAYQGYSYLRNTDRKLELVRRVSSRAVGTDLADDVAYALFGEILESGEPGERVSLARTYVRHFPDTIVAFDVTRMLLREAHSTGVPGSAPSALASQVAQLGGGRSRFVLSAVASWLVETKADAHYAAKLLEASLARLNAEVSEETEGHAEPTASEGWKRDQALYRYFLGRARHQMGDFPAAKTLLDSVVTSQPTWGGPHFYLGNMAMEEGRTVAAIRHLRRHLELPNSREEAVEMLSSLLGEEYGYEGDPRTFFRDREGGLAFSDITGVAGLSGVRARRVAWGDYDNDGYEDVLLDGSRLFRNQGDGSFSESTQQAGLSPEGKANLGLWADYDSDGFLDIFVAGSSGARLWRNMGDGRFADVTHIALAGIEVRFAEAAAWGEMDNDGDLDLYLASYERPAVTRGICVQDRLLRNRGGTFTDASAPAGILSEEPMCGRGVTWSDVNGDGWQDILVANYRLDPNFLWRNQGDGTFTDAAAEKGMRGRQVGGAFGHTIGIASGDLDGDGTPDLYLSNLAHPWGLEFSDVSMLLVNSGPPRYRFTDRFADSGIAFEETSSDPALADVDNDGDLDLYVTSVYPGRHSHLYLNDGHSRFEDQTWLTGTRVENGWGAAFADFDNDGDADLLVASRAGVRLFRNGGSGNHWLKVRIHDRTCNRFGVGSKVTVRHGGKSQTREVTAGRGTGSQDSVDLLFGLGTYAGPLGVEVTTLCGDTWTESVPGVDRTLILSHP